MIDFSPLDDLLKTYVRDGQVDYSRWQKESIPTLESWLTKAQTIDLEAVSKSEGIAFLINLYNALTIHQVLQHYPINSIRPKVFGIPNWSKFLLFFKRSIHTLNGQTVSLDNIEHDILRDRYTEERIHFALVCASESCPNLRAEAYWPDQLEAQLQTDAKRFITNPTKVKYNATDQILYCSKIFKWYEADFLTKANSIPAYIQSFLGIDLPSDVAVEYLPYSWQLNDQQPKT